MQVVAAGPDDCSAHSGKSAFSDRSYENGRGGKSELRRVVCRITSGTADSSPLDGKCHRKNTALAATPGKGEKVR